MAQTFNDEAAGIALSRLARARASDPEIATPADVCLFAWIVAEAARQSEATVTTSISRIFEGYSDDKGQVAKVGLSLNTIRAGLVRLEHEGFLAVEQGKALRGGGSEIAITVRSH